MPVKRKLAKNKSKGRAYGTAGIQQSSRRTRRTMAKEINAGLQIVYRKLSEMHPNPKNPRKQGDDGIVPLAESIEANPQFFEARPILLSDRTGKLVIIGGEQAKEAALTEWINQDSKRQEKYGKAIRGIADAIAATREGP